jgi:hypothetical protein
VQPEIHQRLEDRPEREREGELAELGVAQRAAGDDEEDEQQAGARGGDAGVGHVAEHQRAAAVDSISAA